MYGRDAVKPRKTTTPATKSTPSHFFVKELKGENPLTLATAKRLYTLGDEFFGREPWTQLSDVELILVRPAGFADTCYGSVMGAGGQVFSLRAYIGDEGFRLFRRIVSDERISPGEFYAMNRSVSIELVTPSEQTPPDRELIRAMGTGLRKGAPVPLFRAGRPGFHPWFVTEEEGQLLSSCIDVVTIFSDYVADHPDINFWPSDTTYPLLTGERKGRGKEKFVLTACQVAPPPIDVRQLPPIDTARIDLILSRGYPMRGVIEIDLFYSASMVGGKYERKATVRGALVADAESGIVLRPELGAPFETLGDVLTRALLSAIESSELLPREVRVRNVDSSIPLRPLESDLRLSLQVVDRLPACDQAKKSRLRMMGDLR